MKKKVIAICGPTASGKTNVAIELANKVNGEIISCDSIQIYKYMDIGSAKPTVEERKSCVHHLIDFVEPSAPFSCVDYQNLAKKCIDDISSRGKMPIFCGGTGLYLDSVLFQNEFTDVTPDETYRSNLEKYSNDELYSMLCECDEDSSKVIHKNNRKRVIRALEIFHETGKPKSFWDKQNRLIESEYDFYAFMLNWPRDVLYRRIDYRVEKMIENGLIEEALKIRGKLGLTAAQAIGYKELFDYFDGNISLSEAIDKIKVASRNYAKRQITWFNHRDYITNIDVENEKIYKNIVNIIIKLLKNCNFCDIIT